MRPDTVLVDGISGGAGISDRHVGTDHMIHTSSDVVGSLMVVKDLDVGEVFTTGFLGEDLDRLDVVDGVVKWREDRSRDGGDLALLLLAIWSEGDEDGVGEAADSNGVVALCAAGDTSSVNDLVASEKSGSRAPSGVSCLLNLGVGAVEVDARGC